MKIVLPEYVEILSDDHVSKLKKLGVIFYNDFPKNEEEFMKRTKEAEIIVMKWWPDISKNIINNASKLRYIITLSTGTNFVDVDFASKKGVKVINCPHHNVHAVAEHVFALMFGLIRSIVEAQMSIQKSEWKKSPYFYQGTELSEKKLGIIGYGKIGKEVAIIGKAIGMNIQYVNSKSTSGDIDRLISNSDFISLNIPFTKTTKNLIDKRRINLMKKTAYIINASRGYIIDQQALFVALKNKRIAGAGLDVFVNEPTIGKAPQDIVKLAKLSNVVTTPHIGFNTKESALRLGDEFIENIEAILKGKPINVVN